jgi:hypothetical protein
MPHSSFTAPTSNSTSAALLPTNWLGINLIQKTNKTDEESAYSVNSRLFILRSRKFAISHTAATPIIHSKKSMILKNRSKNSTTISAMETTPIVLLLPREGSFWEAFCCVMSNLSFDYG